MVAIREAGKKDAEQFLGLVKALADFEKLEGPDWSAQERLIKDGLLDRKFRVLLAFEGSKAIGYAVYFFTYSTFLAKPTLYLEDVFVLETHRNEGIGKELFLACAKAAVKNGCGRMEFAVLDWNKNAIDFYEKMGARRLNEWLYYRLDEMSLKKLSEE